MCTNLQNYCATHISRENSQNLQHHLWDREIGYQRRQPSATYTARQQCHEREFHKCITPNLTIQNVDKPLGYMRKFTPDGRLLISFSHNQRSLEVYRFEGVPAVASLVQHLSAECITALDQSAANLRVRQQVFERLFRLKWTIRVAHSARTCLLNREFSIFLDDGRYVLVAATMPLDQNAFPPIGNLFLFADLFDDCEFLSYVFYLIDLQQGCVSDALVYRTECILLSHNHGVSVCGRSIALLSKYRQSIDLFALVQGKMLKITTIGDFANDQDAALFREVPEYQQLQSDILPLSCLKQRILAHMYLEIMAIESAQMRQTELKAFYANFRIYERMIMWKIQLIDEDHILIRYDRRVETYSGQSDKPEFKLYVVYCISESAVLRVFPKDSVELLYLLRNCCDQFRNVRSLQTQRPSSSPSNNEYFRAAFNSAISSISGGQNEAALRYNTTLPISTQSFATTQYMDFSLFNYDDRLISALERPKVSSLEPIRFSDRNTNTTKFRLFLESPAPFRDDNGAMSPANHRELVAFIFHPYEPFIISIQKILSRYVVNFHIYNESTIVKQ